MSRKRKQRNNRRAGTPYKIYIFDPTQTNRKGGHTFKYNNIVVHNGEIALSSRNFINDKFPNWTRIYLYKKDKKTKSEILFKTFINSNYN